MEQLIIEYAPLIIIVVYFLTANHVYVKPEELEKKHREILDDIEKRFVSWVAFRELQKNVDDMKEKIDKIFEILIAHKEEE